MPHPFRRSLFSIALVAVALAFLPAVASGQTCGQTYALIAGQHMNAGTVNITQTGSQMIVTYQTTGDWLITETHLHVATSLAGIPANKKGSPIPGKFAYKSSYDPGVTSAVYVVDLTGVPPGTWLYIGAHAVVQSPTFGGQTAWSDGADFPGANWFTYSTFRTCRIFSE